MSEMFGPITPFLLMALVTGITQFVKNNWQLSGRAVQLIALAVAALLLIPFHLLTSETLSALGVFEAIVYAIGGWLTAIGLFEVVAKSWQQAPR